MVLSQLVRTLTWIWSSWLAIFLIEALMFSPGKVSTAFTIGLTVAHACVVVVILLSSAVGRVGMLLVLALLTRVGAMFVDLYGSVKLPITASPDDARFLAAGTAIASDLSLAGQIYGGNYSSLLGYIFHFVGPSALTAQYMNVLFGTSAVVVLLFLLCKLDVSYPISNGIVMIAAFMPAAVCFSAQLLRESLVQFLVTLSMACFLIGLLNRKWRWTLFAVLFTLMASLFHAGVIAFLIGYGLVVAFTRFEAGHLKFSPRRFLPTAMLALIAWGIILRFPDLFLGKFQAFDSGQDVLASTNRREGGAAYLTSLHADSTVSLVLQAPLRALYFLLSPLPWNWRGLVDVFAFCFDSAIYLVALGLALPRKTVNPDRKMILGILVVLLTCAVLVFGLGVSNGGTAMRHRNKLIMIILAMSGLALDRWRSFRLGRVGNGESSESKVHTTEALDEKSAAPSRPAVGRSNGG